MKASRFTDSQKAFIIKQGEEGRPIADVIGGAILDHSSGGDLQSRAA